MSASAAASAAARRQQPAPRGRRRRAPSKGRAVHPRARFSAGVVARLRAQFDMIDTDNSGAIDAREAAQLAAAHLKPDATARQARDLGERLRFALDVDGDGKISFEEYATRFGPRLQMAEARLRRGLSAHPGHAASRAPVGLRSPGHHERRSCPCQWNFQSFMLVVLFWWLWA